MKITDVPQHAFTAEPTPIPTKQVYDWDALHDTLVRQGFVVIETDQLRTLTNNAEEAVLVKMFNSHLRTTKKLRLQTKRISANRWFCTL